MLKFGTDGIRGRAYDEVTVADVEALAFTAGRVLGGAAMVIGTDTRESGPDFVAAICRGVARLGIEPWFIGDAPTPAVAAAALRHGVPGAMVSASHNPFHDNGIKFFGPGGRKLTDAQQETMEAELASLPPLEPLEGVTAIDRSDLVAAYGDAVAASVDGRGLDGLRLVVDCANGAASTIAPATLAALGAEVISIHDQPDGRNINAGAGSTDMARLRERVRQSGASLGIAFDGDADRMLAVDGQGEVVDGDEIIAICAIDRSARGTLTGDTVVVTIMTNLGFHQGMARRGIAVHQTPVGDRHVLEALERNNWDLGGEQSGHVIFHDLATTGDGLLTCVQLLDTVVRSGLTLAELAADAMIRLPQRLRNVRIQGAAGDAMESIADDIARVSDALGDRGRLLVRPSGTEPLIRFMAEDPTQAEADGAVDDLIGVLEGR
ncbi:MAG: phosphoglucosamine mutase [Actinomycetota bacterium]